MLSCLGQRMRSCAQGDAPGVPPPSALVRLSLSAGLNPAARSPSLGGARARAPARARARWGRAAAGRGARLVLGSITRIDHYTRIDQ